MLKNTKQEGEDGEFTAVLKTKEDYAQAVTAIRDFIKSDLKGIYEDTQKSVSDLNFDVEKYFDNLFQPTRQMLWRSARTTVSPRSILIR